MLIRTGGVYKNVPVQRNSHGVSPTILVYQSSCPDAHVEVRSAQACRWRRERTRSVEDGPASLNIVKEGIQHSNEDVQVATCRGGV